VTKQDKDTGYLQTLLHLRSLFWLHVIAFAIITFSSFTLECNNQYLRLVYRQPKTRETIKVRYTTACVAMFFVLKPIQVSLIYY